jgi:DNA-binding XRE family transcriptional regulator
MTTADIGALIERARAAAGLSQRALADMTGISQPTLSRIISGDRVAKIPEIIAIAWATGHTVAQLTGAETVAESSARPGPPTTPVWMACVRRSCTSWNWTITWMSRPSLPRSDVGGPP